MHYRYLAVLPALLALAIPAALPAPAEVAAGCGVPAMRADGRTIATPASAGFERCKALCPDRPAPEVSAPQRACGAGRAPWFARLRAVS